MKHTGIVTQILDDSVMVTLDGNINCSSCHAKGGCGAAESEAKEVEILHPDQPYHLHEIVEVTLQEGLGLKAVFWAYVFPFLLILFTIILGTTYLEEWLAGVLGIAILVPYYFLLPLLNKQFSQTFEISIKKI